MPSVELAVCAKMQAPAIMILRRAQVVKVKNDAFTACKGDVAVRSKTAHAVMWGRRSRGVEDIEVMIGEKIGIKRDPQQAAFIAGTDLWSQIDERSGEK